MAEKAFERTSGRVRQLSDGQNALVLELRLGDGADAPHQADRQVVEEREFRFGIDHDQAVRLGDLRCDLGQMLGPRHPDRDRKPELGTNALTDQSSDLGRGAEEMRASGDVRESLVDRDTLHERREIAQDSDGRVPETLVLAEMPADEDQLGAQRACLPARHATVGAGRLGLVGGSEDHAPRRRRWACLAGSDRAAAPPRRRTRRGRRGGCWPASPRRHPDPCMSIYSHIPRILAFRFRGGIVSAVVRAALAGDQTRCSNAWRT